MKGMCNSEKVVYRATIYLMKNSKESVYDSRTSVPNFQLRFQYKHILGSQLEIGNRGTTVIDTLFPTIYSEDKQPYRGGFGV